MLENQSKKCSKCFKLKLFSEFKKDRSKKDGYYSSCKICVAKYRQSPKGVAVSKKYSAEYCKNRSSKQIEDDKKRCSQWHYNNKNRAKEYASKYFKSEKGKIANTNSKHKRRDLKIKNNDGSIPINYSFPLTKELHLLLIKQDNKCFLCECDIHDKKHLDHWIPLSKGGNHSINNVVFLCPSCNLKKGNSSPSSLLMI